MPPRDIIEVSRDVGCLPWWIIFIIPQNLDTADYGPAVASRQHKMIQWFMWENIRFELRYWSEFPSCLPCCAWPWARIFQIKCLHLPTCQEITISPSVGGLKEIRNSPCSYCMVLHHPHVQHMRAHLILQQAHQLGLIALGEMAWVASNWLTGICSHEDLFLVTPRIAELFRILVSVSVFSLQILPLLQVCLVVQLLEGGCSEWLTHQGWDKDREKIQLW